MRIFHIPTYSKMNCTGTSSFQLEYGPEALLYYLLHSKRRNYKNNTLILLFTFQPLEAANEALDLELSSFCRR